jgi:hypothetical protein
MHPKILLLLLATDVIAVIFCLSQSATKPETSLVEIRCNFDMTASPKLTEFITTAIEVGKVTVKIGEILTPWIAAGSIFLSSAEHFPQPSLPSDSSAEPLPWRIEQSQ